MNRRLAYGPYTFAMSRSEKVLYPDAGIAKADVLDYYDRIAEWMLPHVRGRPISMERHPDGIGDGGFYEKIVPDHFPDWVDRVAVSRKDGTSEDQVVIGNRATLAYLASQACLTPHVWASRKDRLSRPDRMIFDLDPSTGDFDAVRRAALRLRDALEEAGLVPFAMTTGSRGLHVVVPIRRGPSFEEVRETAGGVAERLADRFPDDLTTKIRKEKRGDRIFLDTLRNARGQTTVAPYALRALPGAPVATPLDWDEVADASLTPRRHTLANVFRRLGQKSAPWSAIGRRARTLPAHSGT